MSSRVNCREELSAAQNPCRKCPRWPVVRNRAGSPPPSDSKVRTTCCPSAYPVPATSWWWEIPLLALQHDNYLLKPTFIWSLRESEQHSNGISSTIYPFRWIKLSFPSCSKKKWTKGIPWAKYRQEKKFKNPKSNRSLKQRITSSEDCYWSGKSYSVFFKEPVTENCKALKTFRMQRYITNIISTGSVFSLPHKQAVNVKIKIIPGWRLTWRLPIDILNKLGEQSHTHMHINTFFNLRAFTFLNISIKNFIK